MTGAHCAKCMVLLKHLDWLQAHYGYPPTVRELQASLGWSSPSVVAWHLKHLREQGLIKRQGRKPRALRMLGGSGALRQQAR